MPEKLLHTFFFVLLFTMINAQQKGYDWNISSGINVPAGIFSETHFIGISVKGEYSRGRFGIIPRKQLDYFFGMGIDHYFGKKEIVSGYPFKYSGYFIFHSNVGLIWNAGKDFNFRIGAGPALSMYRKSIRFNILPSLAVSWYISKNKGITSGIQTVQEIGAIPLWAVFVCVHKAF